ncbi:MAG: response regulator transcription factor [Saprospiraceae bacterium]|nr:response regulator transcription factor [Saprospiraceae bacterium]
MRVLLVEDEPSLRKVVKLNLELEKYEVIEAEDGLIAKEKLDNEYFDIVILDLMLPHINGLDILEFLRLKKSDTPVIITSAKDTSTDRIKGLKSGADDYLTKPFEIEELLLRIQNLLSRRPDTNIESTPDKYSFGVNTVDFSTFSGTHKGESFILKRKEVQLLKLLINKKNEVVSRQDILKLVWGYDVFPSTRTIDNFIASLRKHFEEDPRHPKHIHSIRGVGYRFTEE